MNAVNDTTGTGFRWKWTWSLALVICLGLVAIDAQSFWIDEAVTAIIAHQPTLSKWWQVLSTDGGSSMQMPLYMIYVWAWEKIFGHGEWWLRASNLPWLALGLLAIPRQRIPLLSVVAVSPFVWYYLNESRPYLMQLSASLMILGSLWELEEVSAAADGPGEKFRSRLFCFGLVTLSGSSLLGMIWAGAILVAVLMVLGWPKSLQLVRRSVPSVILAALLLSALALYYLWSLSLGARAAPFSAGLGNILFTFYELLGFAGLGPGREQLRTGGLASLRPFIPLLAPQAAVTACVLFAGSRRMIRNTPRRLWLRLTVVMVATVIFLLVAGGLSHFRVLGRHLTPLEPALFLLLAGGLRGLWSQANWGRALAILFLLLNLASGVSLRLAERHAKEDYRSAAAVAIAANARGEQVWWCACGSAGRYYGVPMSLTRKPGVPGEVWWAVNPSVQVLTNQPPPDLVILSRPEIHDPDGLLRAYLASHQYHLSQTFPVFTLWRKNGN